MALLSNVPTLGYIRWQDLLITYKNVTYQILNNHTCKPYIYFDALNNPNELIVSNKKLEERSELFYIIFNDEGKYTLVPQTEIEVTFSENSSANVITDKIIGFDNQINEQTKKIATLVADVDGFSAIVTEVEEEINKTSEKVSRFEQSIEDISLELKSVEKTYNENEELRKMREDFNSAILSVQSTLGIFSSDMNVFMEDNKLSSDEKNEINAYIEQLNTRKNKLSEQLDVVIKYYKNLGETSKVNSLTSAKNDLNTSLNNLVNNIKTVISDSNFTDTEITTVISYFGKANVEINECKNLVDEYIQLGVGGVLVEELSGIYIEQGEINLSVSKKIEELSGIEVGSVNYFRYSNFARPNILGNWGISNTSFHTESIGTYNRESMGRQLDVDKHIANQNIFRSSVDIAKAKEQEISYVNFNPYNNGRYYMQLEANTEYTFSYWIYLGGNTKSSHATVYYKNDSGTNTTLVRGESTTTYTGAFQKQVIKFKTNNYNEINITFYHYPKTDLTEGNSTIFIYQPLVTKGNKELDWTENPFDIEEYEEYYMQSQISEAKSEIKITTDGISQEVSNLTKTVSTKADNSALTTVSNKVSSIETSLGGITSRVQTVEETAKTANANALKNHNNLLINSNIKNGVEGWRLFGLELGTTLRSSTTTATSLPDRHTIVIGDNNDNSAKTRYMDSTKFIVQAGEKISVSYYIMANQYVSYARVYILFTDNTSPIEEDNTFFDEYTYTGVSGNTTWTKKTETVTVPTGATRAFIRIRYQSLEKPSTSDQNKAVLASIMVSRGSEYPTWAPNTEDSYYYHEKRLKTAEQKITEDAITSTVSSTYYKKTEIDSQVKNINNSINNIQVGGENLLSFTDFSTDKYLNKWQPYFNTNGEGTLVYIVESSYDVGCFRVYSSTPSVEDVPPAILHNEYIKLIGGQEYTLSFSAKSGGHTTTLDYIFILNYDEGGSNQRLPNATIHANNSDLDKVRSSITFTPSVNIEKARILIGCADATVSSNYKGFYIKNIKLEKGNKATDWCPSPKDAEYEIDATNNKLTSLTKRVSTAEQKITDDSITNLVKQSFYTKEQTDTAITSKGYQTASQVQQTVGAFELKFQQSGGYNMLRNSMFKKGVSYWQSYYDTSKLTRYNINAEGKIACRVCWNSTADTSARLGIQYTANDLTFTANKWYTLTFRMRAYYGITPEQMTYNFLINPAGTGNKQINAGSMGGSDRYSFSYETSSSGYYLVRISFRPTETYEDYGLLIGASNISATMSGDNPTGFGITEIMLCEGQLGIGWTPHPSEVYDGITTIDKDGITVSNSNANTTTSMTANGFYINQSGSGDVFKVDSSGISLSQGIVTLNKNGLTINSTNSNTKTQITANGFYISNENVNVLKVDSNGLVLDQGNVSITKDGLILKSPTGDIQTRTTENGFYIAKGGTNVFYANANGVSVANDNVTINANGVTVQSPNVNTITYMNANGFNIKNGDEYVFTVNSNGIKLQQGIVIIDKDKIRITHSDGSYTQMSSGGFLRYVNGTNKYYHYLISTGTVNVRDGIDATVQLPDEFKGKNFYVTVSAFKTNIISGWEGIYDIDSLIRSYDRPNGRFTIGGMVNSTNGLEGTLDVSYIAIA